MADPTPDSGEPKGGLLGTPIDPEAIQKLIAQFGAQPQDKQLAAHNALMTFGLGVLAGRGNLGNVIGNAGLLGSSSIKSRSSSS